MAKNNTALAEPVDAKASESDAPLIDLNEANVKKMIARAKKRGYITIDELNAAIPADQSDRIEDIMSNLSEMGINVVEIGRAHV